VPPFLVLEREGAADARRDADRVLTATLLEGLERREEGFLDRAVDFRLFALLAPALRPAVALRVALVFDLAISTLLLAAWTPAGDVRSRGHPRITGAIAKHHCWEP
jgi:hypothetical protein